MNKGKEFNNLVRFLQKNGNIESHSDYVSYEYDTIHNSTLIYNSKFKYISVIIDYNLVYHIRDSKLIKLLKEMIKELDNYSLFDNEEIKKLEVFKKVFEEIEES